MNRHVLEDIPFNLKPESIAKQIRIKQDAAYFDNLVAMAAEAEKIARPKGLYRAVFVEKHGDDQVAAEGAVFKSRVLKVNVETVHRVFPFAATCGVELDQWSGTISDTLDSFMADAIKATAMQAAALAIDRHIQENYHTGKVSRMTPGSLEDWPLTEQRPLFDLLGNVEEDIGVRLMDSLMMRPKQSVSGIVFPAEIRFESCQLCPMENCPGRRAAYDRDLYEKKYKIKLDRSGEGDV